MDGIALAILKFMVIGTLDVVCWGFMLLPVVLFLCACMSEIEMRGGSLR